MLSNFANVLLFLVIGLIFLAFTLFLSRLIQSKGIAGKDKYIPYEFAGDMGDAVKRAFLSAAEGDVILLAPACSSFDMFTDYAHRGRVFKEKAEGLNNE